MSELKEIGELLDTTNFGEWLDKINEVISVLNPVQSYITKLQPNISYGQEHGLLCETLPTRTDENFDNIITNSIFYIKEGSNTNTPESSTSPYILFVYSADDSGVIRVFQIAISLLTSRLYYRTKTNTTFTAWKFIPDLTYIEDNFLMLRKVDADGNDVVQTVHTDLTFDNKTTLNTMVVNNTSTFKNYLDIQDGFLNHFYINHDSNSKTVSFSKTDGTATVAYTIDGNVVLNSDGTVAYEIINDSLVESRKIYTINDDIRYIADLNNKIQFYIQKDNTITTNVIGSDVEYTLDGDEIYKNSNIVYKIIGDNIYKANETYNIVNNKVYNKDNTIAYHIYEDKLYKNTEYTITNPSYYIKDNTIYLEETYDTIIYYIKNNVIYEVSDVEYMVVYKRTLRNFNDTIEYYIHSNNYITKDVNYNPSNIAYIIKSNDTIITDTNNVIKYYVVNNSAYDRITRYIINEVDDVYDMYGIKRYTIDDNNILEVNVPILVSKTNVCDINGNAVSSNSLNRTGMLDSFRDSSLYHAASNKCVNDLYQYSELRYMPYEGGTFTNIVVHNDDIRLAHDNEGRPAKLYSYDDLTFQCLKSVNIVANNETCELYLDKDNEAEPTKPCIIGGRTRTGVTPSTSGSVVYALGSVEFTENTTTIRLRKTNVTEVENPIDEKTNVAVVLERTDEGSTSFRPSEDGVISLGTGAIRYNQIYSSVSSISTSDKTKKVDIEDIDKSLLNKWSKVQWKAFKFKDSVAEKGDKARLHTGLIAQDLENVLSGINVRDYGFFCYDKWDDIYDSEYITTTPEFDKLGKTKDAQELVLNKKVKSAGEQYSLRYQEIQAIENAYLRQKIQELEKEIQKLKKIIK